MLDFQDLETNFKAWQAGLERKGAKVDLLAVLNTRKQLGTLTQQVDELRAQRNVAAKAKDIAAGKSVAGKLKMAEAELGQLEAQLNKLVAMVPNLPLSDVPDGGEDDAVVVEKVGDTSQLTEARDHIQLGTGLGILDIERGTKTSGARFYFLKNEGVELEFALVRWIFDLLKSEGFELLVGPQLVNEKVLAAAGYLGQAADEVYKTQDDLYLIGTAEQSVLGYHMDEVIELPKRYAAFSTCFRREAGSYGKDVKGIIRTHQFDKVEMFSFVAPEDAAAEHDFLVSLEEEILKKLAIPYQKVVVAAGDLGMSAAKKFDLESWIPSQNKYRETHSCSNCTDWQARRANIRYKAGEKNEYVYTLNGTAVAIGRLLVALLENHQQPDGSVRIPAILHPYLSFKEIGVKS